MSASPFNENMTLTEARDILRKLSIDGHACPVCTQFTKVYKRKIHSRMARDLIKFYRAHQLAYGHTTETLGATAPDFTKLVYWGLIEQQPGEREDGSSRTGWWRITSAGIDWLFGRTTVPKYAKVFDGRLLGLDAGEYVSISDALGSKFNYIELMVGL